MWGHVCSCLFYPLRRVFCNNLGTLFAERAFHLDCTKTLNGGWLLHCLLTLLVAAAGLQHSVRIYLGALPLLQQAICAAHAKLCSFSNANRWRKFVYANAKERHPPETECSSWSGWCLVRKTHTAQAQDARVGENVGVSLLEHVLSVVKAGSKRVRSAVLRSVGDSASSEKHRLRLLFWLFRRYPTFDDIFLCFSSQRLPGE